ncbi:hypothetical protein RB601_005612 [Gaeumannomyces tritici]
MAWQCTGTSNASLVGNLAREDIIKSAAVKDAFLKVDRAHYAPYRPYEDSPQPIGHGATISAPHMHATAVQQLHDRVLPTAANPAPRVLDVGSGSGYLTHILAELAGPRGVVIGVEHISELRDLGEANMRKSAEGRALLESGRARFVVGDGRKGWKEGGEEEEGWDVIHVGASAREMHPELLAQLRTPGRMFIPVDDAPGSQMQHVWVVDRDAGGVVSSRKLFGVRYVPLTDSPPRV